MGFLSKLLGGNSGNGILKNPGDSFTARISKTGRGIMKINTTETKTSFVKYPTGTIVKTEVFKKK